MSERQWELYRLSVIEKMPESDYKTAVLAAIAHKLTMLDRMEALQSRFSKTLPELSGLNVPVSRN